MKSHVISLAHNIVLIGGGHSHAILLKLWAMNPIPGIRLTLITDISHTPYSGMLPGHVAGFYNFEETHIDLRRLCRFAQAQFYLDKAIGLDLVNHQVICQTHPPISYDYLSIDIGSTPQTNTVPGASEYSVPAKPVPEFLKAWNQFLETVSNKPNNSYTIGIIGGGAGGVELAFNMDACLTQIDSNAHKKRNFTIHLFHRGKTLLTGQNPWTSQRVEKQLLKRNLKIHLNETVCRLDQNCNHTKTVFCDSGLTINCDIIFWVTQASAANWLSNSGIKTDPKGFILVNDYLQSVSHPDVFAAGDIATIKNFSRPKAGVFAVRQGKPLFHNLQNYILDKKLQPYHPQKYYLSLIGTGNKRAIASWGWLSLEGAWLWQLKDYIDRQFMKQFKDLPTRMSSEVTNEKQSLRTSEKNQMMPCAGCGSKVGEQILDRTLKRLEIRQKSDILIGLNYPDDAAVLKLNDEKSLVQTIDFFPSLVSDPFIFGQITTNHCLSDLWAMGATAHSVSAVVTLPYSSHQVAEEILYQLLQGCLNVLNEADVSLIGGHTLEGSELALGLSCNGFISPDKLLTKRGMKVGDVLILTKALGSGTLFAADMRYQAQGRWIDNAIDAMLVSNQKAAEIMLEFGATACTDITGFGLCGHLVEMLQASQTSAILDLKNIPILTGAIETIAQGITSSLSPQNQQFSRYITNLDQFKNLPQFYLLFDPQTSGGLLASIPLENAQPCLQKLIDSNYNSAKIIGKVSPKNAEINITLI